MEKSTQGGLIAEIERTIHTITEMLLFGDSQTEGGEELSEWTYEHLIAVIHGSLLALLIVALTLVALFR